MCAEVHEKTGHWPAMIGLDYADFANGGLEDKTVNRVAIKYAKQGGWVTISAHLNNPANPKSRGPWEQGGDVRKLVAPGEKVHDDAEHPPACFVAGVGRTIKAPMLGVAAVHLTGRSDRSMEVRKRLRTPAETKFRLRQWVVAIEGCAPAPIGHGRSTGAGRSSRCPDKTTCLPLPPTSQGADGKD